MFEKQKGGSSGRSEMNKEMLPDAESKLIFSVRRSQHLCGHITYSTDVFKVYVTVTEYLKKMGGRGHYPASGS